MSDNITSSDFTMEGEIHHQISISMGSGSGVVGQPARKRKPRMKWCFDLHELFIDAVNNLGGPFRATPTAIIQFMGVRGLDVSHVKSHLQMYRTQMGSEAMFASYQARQQRKKNKRCAEAQPIGAGGVRSIVSKNPHRLDAPRRGGLIIKNKFIPIADLRNLFQEIAPGRRVLVPERLKELRRRYNLPDKNTGDSTVTTESVDSNETEEEEESSVCMCDLDLDLKLSTGSGEEVENEERERKISGGERGNVDLSLSLAPPKAPYPDLSKFK